MAVSTDAVKDGTAEPVSAFAVYSEMLRRKKKTTANGRVNKIKKNLTKTSDLKTEQMREIGTILQKLAETSGTNYVLDLNVTNPSSSQKDQSDATSKLALFNIKSKAKNRALGKNSNYKSVLEPYVKKSNMNSVENSAVSISKRSQDAMVGNLPLIQNAVSNLSIKEKKEKTKTVKKNVTIRQKNIKSKLTKTINLGNTNENGGFMDNRSIDESTSSLENNVEENETKSTSKLTKLKLRRRLQKLSPQAQYRSRKLKKSQPKTALDKKQLNNVAQSTENHGSESGANATAGIQTFEWVILPVPEKEFAVQFWERQPLLIQRRENPDFYSDLLSTPAIDEMLRKNVICFTKHLDITSYSDGVRETHNLTGRANANVVWDFYSNGCSVRLLNPQAFFPQIHSLNASLQEYFGCFVGANVYLTPPNSQGFAPHYDDIEAFVLQIEGKKRWKLYAPRNDSEVLARFSSPNFRQDEIGKPCLDIILEPGDMLYFPRGFIHQAVTVDDCHSLHITLSAYQKTAWVDLFEKALPLALEKAATEDVEFRRGLPRDYLNCQRYGGDAVEAFKDKAKLLLVRLAPHFVHSLNAAVDKMGAQFMHDALPPVLSPEEEVNSVSKGGLRMVEGGVLKNMVDFQPTTRVKLIRANVCRLVKEEGESRLYHCLDNSLEYHAEDPQFLVLPPNGGRVVKSLARAYPSYTPIFKLPHKGTDIDGLLNLISDLWDAGLLLAKT